MTCDQRSAGMEWPEGNWIRTTVRQGFYWMMIMTMMVLVKLRVRL